MPSTPCGMSWGSRWRRHISTNASRQFLRNRIRHELLPQLEAEYSPALRRHLLRLARLAEEEVAFLDVQAQALLEAAQVRRDKDFNTETRRHSERCGAGSSTL